jgi:hypothetical protein
MTAIVLEFRSPRPQEDEAVAIFASRKPWLVPALLALLSPVRGWVCVCGRGNPGPAHAGARCSSCGRR